MQPQLSPEALIAATITAAEFAAVMAPFRLTPGAQIAVAVSGGADSLALVRLLAQWARAPRIAVFALTVDHQLRDAAASEAAQVGRWLEQQEIPHTVLRWADGPHARTLARSAQNAARDARYRLMTDWCAAHGCSHLLVAHHADDQVETFLLRLARGSGVDGLSAMAPSSRRDGITIARPLLMFPKTRLTATCRALGQAWIEDPSNRNAASGRVRFRHAQEILEKEGFTRDRLLATVGHLQRARAALDYAVSALLAQGAWDALGVARIPVAALCAAPEEIALRALARALAAAGGQTYGPRFESLARLYARLTSGPWRDASLHGCLLTREGDHLVIVREVAQISDEKNLRANTSGNTSTQTSVTWDGRFKLTLVLRDATATVADLFVVRRLDLRGMDIPESLRTGLAALPSRLRETLPALCDAAGIAAVPHVGYVRADVAQAGNFSLAVACICDKCGDAADI